MYVLYSTYSKHSSVTYITQSEAMEAKSLVPALVLQCLLCTTFALIIYAQVATSFDLHWAYAYTVDVEHEVRHHHNRRWMIRCA